MATILGARPIEAITLLALKKRDKDTELSTSPTRKQEDGPSMAVNTRGPLRRQYRRTKTISPGSAHERQMGSREPECATLHDRCDQGGTERKFCEEATFPRVMVLHKISRRYLTLSDAQCRGDECVKDGHSSRLRGGGISTLLRRSRPQDSPEICAANAGEPSHEEVKNCSPNVQRYLLPARSQVLKPSAC